jgi:signal transduction histidine kinase
VIPGEQPGTALSRASQVNGELLYQTRLSAPLDQLQLIFSVRELPAGPGARVVYWASGVLLVVLLGGLGALYHLGLRQLLLARQQQDFVSAVSHELKTPLTSIRMYAEMLRAGWASEDKKASYYQYIYDESERLSRLIANVLQLARMERSDFALACKPMGAAELLDLLRSKIHTQIEHAGFAVEYRIDAGCHEAVVAVDADAWCQIMINLVDNAIKYAKAAPERRIEIALAPGDSAADLIVSVRDFGPGVPRAQMGKIFQLFYRSGSELTRESLGTGIGLALVRQLARAMGGDVQVCNRQPGAEFRLRLRRVR